MMLPSKTTQPVPILLMARHLDQGGIERDLTKIALGLDRSRFYPHVATYFDYGMRLNELRASGVPVLYIPVGSILSFSAFKLAWRLGRYLREHKIRLVHTFDTTAFFGASVARLAGVPRVLTSQLGHRVIRDARGSYDRRTAVFLRMSDRLTDAIQVNCQAMAHYMVRDEHIPAERLELCYNGVDTETFYPSQDPKPDVVAGASLVVGSLCALRPEKNLLLLQEAFATVRGRLPGMRLLFVGSGDELQRLRDNGCRLGLTNETVYVPATPDAAYWMRAIDVFVLPSYSEAFSNALLEAMACGCAVIGSRVGGTPEMIGENERGLLFESGNAEDLSARLLTMIEDQQRRRAFGAAAARYAQECLSLGIAVTRQMEIYESLLTRRAHPVSREGSASRHHVSPQQWRLH
jgi:glycosyltransferase involved in cell wall biosynthesis